MEKIELCNEIFTNTERFYTWIKVGSYPNYLKTIDSYCDSMLLNQNSKILLLDKISTFFAIAKKRSRIQDACLENSSKNRSIGEQNE